jgi:hypothetical protein
VRTKWIQGVLAAAVLLFAAGQTRAELLTVTQAGASFSAGNDSFTFLPTTVTLDLPFGGFVTVNVPDATFHAGVNSDIVAQAFPFTLTRPVTIDGVTRPVSQAGVLSVTFLFGDSVTLFDAPTTTFRVGSGVVAYTPQGVSATAGDVGDLAVPVQGTLELQAVPEPPSLVLLGFGALGLLAPLASAGCGRLLIPAARR